MTQSLTRQVTQTSPHPPATLFADQVAPSFPRNGVPAVPRESMESETIHETEEKEMPATLAVEDLQCSSGEQAYGPQPVERRKAKRQTIYETHWLTISSVTAGFSSFLVAKLIDVSAGGFGIFTLEPVEPGHEYAVAGEIQVDGHWMEISGHTRVVYCRPTKDGTYRVGLEAAGVRCQNIPKPS